MGLILKRVFIYIPTAGGDQTTQHTCGICIQNSGQLINNFMATRLAALGDLFQRVPPPLQTHLGNHRFFSHPWGAGDFDIDIQALGGTCPEETLGFIPVMADINDYENVMSTSCGPSGYQEGAIFYPYADATFAWTSPGKAGANSGCDIIVTSGFPLALSLQRGTCDGPEVQCENGTFNMGTNMYEAIVSVGHIPPTDFTLTVTPIAEPFIWFGGSGFSVELNCFAVG